VLKDKRLWHFVPECFWSGISMAFFIGLLVPMIVQTLPNDDPNTQFMKSILTMVALGTGEMTASLSVGQIIDRKILS